MLRRILCFYNELCIKNFLEDCDIFVITNLLSPLREMNINIVLKRIFIYVSS